MTTLRDTNMKKLKSNDFDVLIIGAGINGAVAAASLASAGAKVALIDKGDFSSCTSQESSNLAWGGIKYMESMEFGLVRKLCLSRNNLLKSYPSSVNEIRFFATLEKGFRHSRWVLYMGGWLYWLIGNMFTKIPKLFSTAGIRKEQSIVNVENSQGGFEYSDAYLVDNDSRFVFNFVRSAINRGCVATNYVRSNGSSRQGGWWKTEVTDQISDESFTIRSKVLINACGPMADEHNLLSGQKTSHRHVFSKGIHLIVDRVIPEKKILTFFADDGRLFFVIPMGPKSCIGTTDTPVKNPETQVETVDREFVLSNINKRLNLEKPLTEADIIAERCGVRPLVVNGEGEGSGDWMKMSRKHVVEINDRNSHISIFGGKLTDCVNVGDEIAAAVQRQGIRLPDKDRVWYGEPPETVKNEFFHQTKLMELDKLTAKESSEPLSTRLWRRYGNAAFELLEDIRQDPTMAEVLIKGTEYIRGEVKLAAGQEIIVKLEDFLRRRSKIALIARKETIREASGIREACQILFGEQAQEKFDEYFNS